MKSIKKQHLKKLVSAGIGGMLMITSENQSVKLIPLNRSFRAEVLVGVKLFTKRGMSLGLMLFMAFGTFNILNYSATHLVTRFKQSSETSRMKKVYEAPVMQRSVSRPVISTYLPRQGRTPDMATTLRESRYLISELGSISRSLIRPAR